MIVDEGRGNASAACRALDLRRSTFYRRSRKSPESQRLETAIVNESHAHPRYGYRRVTAMLHRAGEPVNAKRVQRVRRAEGLQVTTKQRKTRRAGDSTGPRRRAAYSGEVWSWDFVHDATESGRGFRMLTLLDEHTRQCLAVHAARSIRAADVITVVGKAMRQHGPPAHIRSDNGPEFIARAVQSWLGEQNVKTLYITPGSPWENGHIESFHGKLRDECLNRELFANLAAAKILLEQWRQEYNQCRPHSSLGYKTPDEFAASCNRRLQSDSVLLPSPIADNRTSKQTTTQPAELHF